jgi:lipopolysaccharide export system protein LptA
MKLLKFLLLSIFIGFNASSSEKESLELFSEKADFNGKDLSLKGVIKLKHPLGNLEAKKAFFDNKKDSIILEDNVKLTIPKKGLLKSSHAIYNTKSKKLNFDAPVSYKSLIPQKNQNILLLITSKKAECIKNLESQKINFLEDVILNLQKNLSIKGEKASFLKDEILVFPKKNNFCLFKSDNIEIKSSLLRLNLKTHNVTFKNPKGVIKKKDLFFSANNLLFNSNKNILILDKNASITHQKKDLFSEKIKFIYDNKKIKKIKSFKNTKILFSGKNHIRIFSTPKVIFDLEKNEITTSNKTKNLRGITFKEKDITIYAKNAFVKFQKDKNIEKIILKGDIHFFSKKFKSPSFGFADILKFKPKENVLTLKSLPQKKVIFWKEDDSLSLSAKKIKIFHDKNFKNEKVKGFGNVKFSLNKMEKKLLQEVFKKYLKEELPSQESN